MLGSERLLVLELCFCCLVVSTWFLAHFIRGFDSLQIWQRCLKGQGYDLHFVPLLKLNKLLGVFRMSDENWVESSDLACA